jgi:hypothetical protein
VSSAYGELFREAYALLHGGRADEVDSTRERAAGESTEDFLARTRTKALGVMRKRLLAAKPPPELTEANRLLLDLLANAASADEALAEQVRSYQCGQFHESVRHSDRLQELVIESQRLDRELILALKSLPADTLADLGVEV